MVYADAGDTIGWQLTGTAPRRRSGRGLLPQPGWEPETAWLPEPVPFADMPCAQDPPLGLIATANANPTAAPEPFLGVDWIEGYRQDRAVELLRDRSHVRDHSIAQWQALFARAGLRSEVVHTWNLRLDFADWVGRISTPPEAIATLRSILSDAPVEARNAFLIETTEPMSFCLKAALILAQKDAP